MDTIETRLAARPRHISAEEWQVRVDLAACYRLLRAFWLGRSDPDPQFGARAGHDRSDPDQPDGADVRRDHRPRTCSKSISTAISSSRPNTSRSMPASSFTARSILRGPMSNAWSTPIPRRIIAVGALRRRAFAAEPVGDALLQTGSATMITRGRLARHGRARKDGGHSIADHPAAGAAQSRAVGDRAQHRRGVLADLSFRALGRSAAEDPGRHRLRRPRSSSPRPRPANAKQHSSRCSATRRVLVGNANGRRCLRLCDRLDPSYRNLRARSAAIRRAAKRSAFRHSCRGTAEYASLFRPTVDTGRRKRQRAGERASQLADRFLVLLVLDLGEVAGRFRAACVDAAVAGLGCSWPSPRRNR